MASRTSAATATGVDHAEIHRQESLAAADVQALELRLEEARGLLRQWVRQWRILEQDRVNTEILHGTTTSSVSVLADENDNDYSE